MPKKVFDAKKKSFFDPPNVSNLWKYV